jgi:galactoside O-acetyltransferase
MLRLARAEIAAYFDALLRAWPGISGQKLRAWYMRASLAGLGASPSIDAGVIVRGARNIKIGSNFSCGQDSMLLADGDGLIRIGNRVALNVHVQINASIGGEIVIADNVLIGPNVLLRASDHAATRIEVPIWQQGHVSGYIKIEDGVWIGGNATILKNVTIGRGAIVAAGAVVNRDIPPYVVAGGVPARVLKARVDADLPRQ